MVFYLHFNTSVFSKMLLVTCYFWCGYMFNHIQGLRCKTHFSLIFFGVYG